MCEKKYSKCTEITKQVINKLIMIEINYNNNKWSEEKFFTLMAILSYVMLTISYQILTTIQLKY